MTAVRDEHGKTLVRNWYESGQLVRQLYANGDEYQYDSTWTTGKHFHYVDSVVVTLPDHTMKRIELANSVPDYIRNE